MLSRRRSGRNSTAVVQAAPQVPRNRALASKQSVRNVSHNMRQDTTRVAGPMDPTPTESTLSLTHKFTHVVTTAADGLAVITSATLFTVFPGTSFAWYRLVKFSVYAPAQADAFVALYPSNTSSAALGGTLSDHFEFLDFGTQGSVRPAIHIQPNWLLRSQWLDLTATANNELFIVKSLPSTEVILQYTLDLKTARPTGVP
jgi:hypothetical protein